MKILCNVIILLLFVIFTGPPCFSEDVFLDLNSSEIHKLDTGKLKYENRKLNTAEEEEDYLKPSAENMKKMFDEDFHETQKHKTLKRKRFLKKNPSEIYDTILNKNIINQENTLHTKKDLTEKMSVDTSYKSNLAGKISEQTKGTVSVAPEYKFSKKASLKNIYSKNLGDKSNKAEVQLKYKPFKDDRMDLNVGAGQRMFDNGQQSSSQINFNTNIRF